MWSRDNWLNRGLIADCCEYGYEISDSVYREEFCDKLCDYWLLSKDSALLTWCVVRKFQSLFISTFPSNYINLQECRWGDKVLLVETALSGEGRLMVPVTMCIYGLAIRRNNVSVEDIGTWVASAICSLLRCTHHKTLLCHTWLLCKQDRDGCSLTL
jgi:hypothetical protein